MMYCETLARCMAANLKLLSDASSEKVDATMYCQMIGSLIVYEEYGTRHMLYGEHPMQVPDGSEIGSPDNGKACSEVPKRYSGLWAQI